MARLLRGGTHQMAVAERQRVRSHRSYPERMPMLPLRPMVQSQYGDTDPMGGTALVPLQVQDSHSYLAVVALLLPLRPMVQLRDGEILLTVEQVPRPKQDIFKLFH